MGSLRRNLTGLTRYQNVANRRLLVVGFVLALLFLLIILRLTYLLWTYLDEDTSPETVMQAQGFTQRGEILDRRGALVALNLKTSSLYANPRVILDAQEIVDKLKTVLPDIDKPGLLAKLKGDKSFIWIRRNLSPRQQWEVNQLGLPGLYFQKEERRVYPNGPLFSHVVGFTNVDGNGLAGIEQYFNEELKKPNTTITLSLDMRVQEVLRDELLNAMTTYRPKGASAILMHVNTGEIYGMVSLPDFDPNNPAALNPEFLFNRNTLGTYEFGSTFKLLTAAMALDSGKVTLQTEFDASQPLRVGRYQIKDYKGKNRVLTFPEVIMYSSNIGTSKMALMVGPAGQKEFLGRLGLLSPATSLELREIGRPIIPTVWKEIQAMTISYGYGVSPIVVQLASAEAALVNGGILYPPTLIKRTQPVQGKRVIQEKTSQQIKYLMRLVMIEGTAKKANVEGLVIGGKTGSANKRSGRRGYSSAVTFASFVGTFPLTDPQFLLLITLDEPQPTKDTFGYTTAGWNAAPVARKMLERLAPLLDLPPVDEDHLEVQRLLKDAYIPKVKKGV